MGAFNRIDDGSRTEFTMEVYFEGQEPWRLEKTYTDFFNLKKDIKAMLHTLKLCRQVPNGVYRQLWDEGFTVDTLNTIPREKWTIKGKDPDYEIKTESPSVQCRSTLRRGSPTASDAKPLGSGATCLLPHGLSATN